MNRFESDMYFRGKEIKSVEGKVREKYDSYIGVKYNNFTVIKILGTVDSDSVARVECVCGTVKLVSFSAIKRGTTRSCGCIKKPREVRTKVGKEVRNRMGDIAVVVEVISATNIKVKFTSTGTIETTTQAGIMKGYFKDRARPSVAGVGYIGVGIYNSSDHNKHYKVWQMMLHRCYDEKVQEKLPTYQGCSVAEEWHNFQNFAEWFDKNYLEDWELDKDLLIKGNKVYSAQTCCFIPHEINILLSNNKANRGKLPVGVIWHKKKGKFVAQCTTKGKDGRKRNKWLYQGDCMFEGFKQYKKFKESLFKEAATKYDGKITEEAYNALMVRVVDIED